MSHFAKVENNLVTQVIVAEPDFIATGALGDPAAWIQTSYNTLGAVHYDNNGNPDAEGVRGNYAGVGYSYYPVNDVFVAPQPSPDHILDTDTWTWWNPTATDPVETKPVKATVPTPVVEVLVESIIDVPSEVVAEEPVAEVVAEEPVAEVVAEEPVAEVVAEETTNKTA